MKNEQLSAQLAKIPSSAETSPQERSAAVRDALERRSEQLISEARAGEAEHEGPREG